MSLSNYSKNKAMNIAESTALQANPDIKTGVGSAFRALVLIPFSLIFAAVIQSIESLRVMFLGNYSSISPEAMDLLASNLFISRPQPSPSTTILRVYTENIEPFDIDVFPYFATVDGIEFSPVREYSFLPADFLEENGEFYVNIQVISEGSTDNVLAGEITEFTQMPIETRRVLNISDASGGGEQLDNGAFYSYIQDTVSDGTTNEIGGVKRYIYINYPEISAIKVITASDPEMVRDEIWSEDGVNPNLDRLGTPFASHSSIGVVSSNTYYGYISGSFSQSMLGKRIAITDDEERFRKILSINSDGSLAVVSGSLWLDSAKSATVWGDAPRIKNMADVYVHHPQLEITTEVVDRRYFLTAAATTTSTKIYYNVASGYSYASVSGTILVQNEGVDSEVIYEIESLGVDGGGSWIKVPSAITVTIGDRLSVYDMSEFELATKPAIYILSVDKLNPLSFEVDESIPRTLPGEYDQPGWYEKNTDPAEVFSSRETKSIKLDSKRGTVAFDPVSITGLTFTEEKQVFKTGQSFSGLEGREVIIARSAFNLDAGLEYIDASILDLSLTEIHFDGGDVDFMGLLGYRDDIRVVVKNSSAVVVETLEPGTAKIQGNVLTRKSGTWPPSSDTVSVYVPFIYSSWPMPVGINNRLAWYDEALYSNNGTVWSLYTPALGVDVDAYPIVDAIEYDAIVVLNSTSGKADLIASTKADLRYSVVDPAAADGIFQVNEAPIVSMTADAEYGLFDASPVRVVMATHTNFNRIQEDIDRNQLLCKDTLVRSFYPTLIDTTIRYSGRSSTEAVYSKFVDLLSTVVREQPDNMRIDISDIVSALDEDGLADSINVGFEVKVTNYLDDGEYEVRYINPSSNTKQNMAMHNSPSSGFTYVIVKRLSGSTNPPGRGIVRLGGNNPSIQERIPYEAAVDNGDETFTLVLRSGYTTSYAHTQWESCVVSKRDYNEDLEYTDGAIFIPKTNRPYPRDVIFIKEQ